MSDFPTRYRTGDDVEQGIPYVTLVDSSAFAGTQSACRHRLLDQPVPVTIQNSQLPGIKRSIGKCRYPFPELFHVKQRTREPAPFLGLLLFGGGGFVPENHESSWWFALGV